MSLSRLGKFMNFGPRTFLAGGLAFTRNTAIGLHVINKTGVAIAADKLVAVTGFDTTAPTHLRTMRPKVVLADASKATHYDVWVTPQAIANGAEGVVYKGTMSAPNLNTNAATAGDPVYASVTPGGFTLTTTPAGAQSILVGYVTVKSATVGQIFWHIGLGMAGFGGVGSGGAIQATMFVAAGAATADFDGRFFQADRAYIATFCREQHQTLGAAATIMVKKVPSGTAKAAGTDMLAAGIDVTLTADTSRTQALHATPANYTLAAGDSLGLVLSAGSAGLDGVTVTVGLSPV